MKKIVEFVIYPEALGLDINGPLDVFTVANELLARAGKANHGYEPLFSAKEPGPLRLCSGLTVMAQNQLGQGNHPDILLIPGGPGAEPAADDPELVSLIRKRAEEAGQVVSVCNGALILAACGLLDGKKATTHWLCTDELGAKHPLVEVEPDAIYVRDGKVATSAGVTAGIDLALALVEEDHGPALVLEVARVLVLYFRRSGGQSQFSAPMESRRRAGKRFGDLHDWILDNLQKSLTVECLAQEAVMSPRNFARVFSQTTGMTPASYVEAVRLDRAREVLESGADSMEQVAQASGFGNEDRLRRSFRRRFGISPAQYRMHFGLKQRRVMQ
jgi:transcriptional regulator GlxA family with amidase domain